MADTKFTKGDWVLGNSFMGEGYKSVNSKFWGEFATVVVSMKGEGESEEGVANSHLIKAAPSLYEALRRFIEFKSDGVTSICDDNDLWNYAEKAMKEAQGE